MWYNASMSDITTSEKATVESTRTARRSFFLLFCDITFFQGALAVYDASTVIPAFLAAVGATPLLVGLITAIRPAATFFPQLWTAHYLRNRTHHKGFLLKVALVSRIATALFGILLFLVGPEDRTLMLLGFVVAYSALWLSEGWLGVSWADILAKAVPVQMRGRLLGYTQFSGGALAILVGILVVHILSRSGPAFPTNYAVLFAVAAVLFSASLASIWSLHEPAGAAEDVDSGFVEYLGCIKETLARYPNLKRLIVVQLLSSVSGMSLPFYILYARDSWHISGGMIGAFVVAQQAGAMLFSSAVGWISDHKGPKWAITMTLSLGMCAPVLALLPLPLYLAFVIFFAVGGLSVSSPIGIMSYLLEAADQDDRRRLVGVLNTANTPSLLFPLLGGILVQIVSYHLVFGITALSLAAALSLAFALPHARHD